MLKQETFRVLLKYLMVTLQVKDVYQRGNGWPAVGTLEGKLTGRQGGNKAATLILVEAIIEFDCTMTCKGGKNLQDCEWQ